MKYLTIISICGLFITTSLAQSKIKNLAGISVNYNKSKLLVIQEFEDNYLLIERDPTTLRPINYYSIIDVYLKKQQGFLNIPSAVSNNGNYYAFSSFSDYHNLIQDKIIIYDLSERHVIGEIDITNFKLKGGQACSFHFNASSEKLYYGTAMEIYEYDLINKNSTKLHETKGYVTYDPTTHEPITCDFRIINSAGEGLIENMQTLGGKKYESDIAFGGIWKKSNGIGYVTSIGNKYLLYTVTSLEIIKH
ncbi:hypothetical protein KEM09_12475 [Carboxylicivirga mesophila]|uniref:Glutamine cyclotransferase n=1 Tax=Carboxylicivirga mesophila TaxID=1166478 RepID=A0ABS5KB17_9BACT|nr:hypothetical protein [Carboxylicivirga mesophila]MBS2212225.1 hypothetical protein [Carboxylicivirga mesophila]